MCMQAEASIIGINKTSSGPLRDANAEFSNVAGLARTYRNPPRKALSCQADNLCREECCTQQFIRKYTHELKSENDCMHINGVMNLANDIATSYIHSCRVMNSLNSRKHTYKFSLASHLHFNLFKSLQTL